MAVILFLCVIFVITYIVCFFNENHTFKVNHLFKMMALLFFTLFLSVYNYEAYKPTNVSIVIKEKHLGFIPPNDSSDLFKNNTQNIFEVIEITKVKKSKRPLTIFDGPNNVSYYIKEKL